MINTSISLEEAKAQLQAMISGPVGRNWHFTPAVSAVLAAIESAGPQSVSVSDDYFSSLVSRARPAAEKAMRKFPQPNYVLLKVAEEAGEVVQAGVHYVEGRMGWEKVEGEIVQLLAMLFRLVTEGDQINGVTPPEHTRAAATQQGAN